MLSPLLIVGFSLFTLWHNIGRENWGNVAFAGFNAFAATWAIVSYIGVKHLLVDIWLGLTDILYVEVVPQTVPQKMKRETGFDWKGVLYHGETNALVPHGAVSDMLSHKKDRSAK